MKNIKKSLLVFAAILIASMSILAPLSYAQTSAPEPVGQGNWWFPRYNDFLKKVNQAPPNEIFGERYTHAQVSWIINSVLNILVGPIASCADSSGSSGQDFGDCLTEALTGSADAGVVLPLAMLNDSFLNTKPASSIDYVATRMHRLGIGNEVYAQSIDEAGFGFANSLAIVQAIWTVARDAAYSLVILMILVLGFMVMFRAQLSPRTTVTIQSALPRVVIGLLLITFSYAIAGLLVDLTFVAQGIVAGIISTATSNGQSIADISAVDAFQQMNSVAGTSIGYLVSILIGFFFTIASVATSGSASGAAALGFIFGTGGAGATLILGLSIIMLLVFVIVLIVALVRLFWIMLKTYVVIIMLTIASPFIFLYGIVKDGMTTLWLKQMVGNLSVFFMVGLMLLLSHIILYTTQNPTLFGGSQVFGVDLADLLGGLPGNVYSIRGGLVENEQAILPGFVSLGSTGLIGVVVSFGLFISIPNFAKGVKDWVITGRGNFERGSAADALGPAAAVGGFIGSTVGGAGKSLVGNYAKSQLTGMLGATKLGASIIQTASKATEKAGSQPGTGRGSNASS